MKCLSLAIVLTGFWQVQTGTGAIAGNGSDAKMVTPDLMNVPWKSGCTEMPSYIECWAEPDTAPLVAPVLVAPTADILRAFIEKHCRVVSAEAQLNDSTNPTIGEIKCDRP